MLVRISFHYFIVLITHNRCRFYFIVFPQLSAALRCEQINSYAIYNTHSAHIHNAVNTPMKPDKQLSLVFNILIN